MMEIIGALLPIAGWLGLGTVTTIGAAVAGFVRPKYLFVAIICAACAAGATFFYAKGAHDDFVLQRARESASAASAIERANEARAAAERDVAKPRRGRVRDKYDRDGQAAAK